MSKRGNSAAKPLLKQSKEIWFVSAMDENELKTRLSQMISTGKVKTCKVKMLIRRKRQLVMQVIDELRVDFPDRGIDWEQETEVENDKEALVITINLQ